MKSKIQIVLGLAFGDEAKGVTTQYLVKEALKRNEKVAVVRFSGGPQAAHTVLNNGIEHICSSFGSGVLLGVPTIYTQNVYFDPICAYNEYKTLVNKGARLQTPMLYVPNALRIITPYDVFAGRLDKKVLKDGSCGKGIYTTFKRYLRQPYEAVWNSNIDNYMNILYKAREHYHMSKDEKIEDLYKEAAEFMPAIATKCFSFIFDDFDTLIFEGTQGLLLDMDYGFYPNVTPSKVGLNGIPEDFLENAEVFLVSRTYLTRHGNGYNPKKECPYDLSSKHETNVTNKYQGKFKTGAIEWDLLNKAFQRHCIDNYIRKYNMTLNMVFSHMDLIPEGEGQGFIWDACTNLDFSPYIDHFYGNSSPESNLVRVYER